MALIPFRWWLSSMMTMMIFNDDYLQWWRWWKFIWNRVNYTFPYIFVWLQPTSIFPNTTANTTTPWPKTTPQMTTPSGILGTSDGQTILAILIIILLLLIAVPVIVYLLVRKACTMNRLNIFSISPWYPLFHAYRTGFSYILDWFSTVFISARKSHFTSPV